MSKATSLNKICPLSTAEFANSTKLRNERLELSQLAFAFFKTSFSLSLILVSSGVLERVFDKLFTNKFLAAFASLKAVSSCGDLVWLYLS